MEIPNTEKWCFTDVRFLPIVREYAKRINLVETVNQMVDSQMELSPGDAILAMVIDTLTGRIPLYRLKESFKDMDTELILGKSINPERFGDTNLGRAMDKIHETGAQKIFSQISQNAIGCFKLNTSGYHFDTTSVSVFGDYDCDDSSLKITYGHSKAKRPDLKQFMVSMLCVDRNIPIIGKTEDGNSSDKTLNNKLLSNVSAYMAKHGVDSSAAIYVADSAFVTEKNIAKAEEKKICFLSRFPANFKECGRVIREAVDADNWEEIGTISKGNGSEKRPSAHYRAFDSNVTVDGKSHRAVVIHSSAHDKRRQKRIDRMLKTDKANLDKKIKEISKTPFQCRPDADAAAASLIHLTRKSLHLVSVEVSEIPHFGRGRPKTGETRVAKSFDYSLIVKIEENPEKTEELRLEAGCFVLITNVPVNNKEQNWSPANLLRLYKNQDGIEKNFGFLKDPAIINAIFLKKPERIEVLGLILLLALLIWRLMERNLKLYVENTGKLMPGWKKRMTKNPTSFMMSTKFLNILVITIGKQRKLARPLNEVQIKYLKALGVSPDIFINP